MADSTMLEAQGLQIEGNWIALPTTANLVEGLDDAVWKDIAQFDNTTLKNELNALDAKYLGISAKASSAGYADSAIKATQDALGRNISTTYYTTGTTVARASKADADGSGNNIASNYALKTGTYTGSTGMTVRKAEIADSATKATQDSAGKTITQTYFSDVSVSGTNLTLRRPDGSFRTVQTYDTTYSLASESANGLMSAADKIKINKLSTDTTTMNVANAKTADAFSKAQQYTLVGGASGSFTVTGANQPATKTQITIGNLNASSVTAGILAVGNGGTGSNNLANVTVGKANQLSTARTVSIGGAVNGSASFDGSSNISIATNNINLDLVNQGVLSTLRGGTGNNAGKAQALVNNVTVNGFSSNFANGTNINWHADCTTAAATAKKAVSITGFSPVKGAGISVKFAYKNTAANPTLAVNNGTAYPIKVNGAALTAFTHSNNEIVQLVFDSDCWQLVNPPASFLATARTIGITGAVSGTAASFDGSGNVNIANTKLNLATDADLNGILSVAHGGTGNSLGAANLLKNAPSVNGLLFDGKNPRGMLAACNSAADVSEKIATIAYAFDGTSTANQYGGVPQLFAVRFAYANTAENPTLNVNGTGAKTIRRGGTTITSPNLFCAYNNQVVWFQRVDSGGQIDHYRIIDGSQFTHFRLTGDVTGETAVSNSAVLSIRTKIDPTTAFEAINVTSATTVVGNTTVYNSDTQKVDLNLFNESGFYRLSIYSSKEDSRFPNGFAHLPNDLASRPTGNEDAPTTYVSYLQVLRSKSSKTFIQILYPAWASMMYVRTMPNGKPLSGEHGSWSKMQSTAVDCFEDG